MERGRDATFTALAGVLLMLIVLAAFLLLMLAPRIAAHQAQPQVGQLDGVKCPAASHAPVCYTTAITNTGTGPGSVTCQVAPAPNTTAKFPNDQTVYTTPAEAPLQPNESFTLTIITKPVGEGKTVAGSPSVNCTGT
jgi:hypothetical protein